MRKILFYKVFLLPFILLACKEKKIAAKNEIAHDSLVAGSVKIDTVQKKQRIHQDIFEFDSYNDDGDYMILNANKNKDLYGFINDKNEDRSLLKGDQIQINWKNDTIYIAGDGETPEIAKWIISVKKIKDGKVSKFRKEYKKELKYHWDGESFSGDYLDKLYLLAEYYIANSRNPLIQQAIKNKEQIEYSIEERTKDNRAYIVLGVGREFEHRFTIIQWIYIDVENHKIYQYDLGNEKLTEFR
ncbi:hypothetical protein ASG22_15025 [Chryseobacterium sp. Leaf405]|uniref:hypothetical protein n=1 Tax=Chryseobacterium sp. Leaf405 TaxID=1736367 RepID=UPI0006F1CE3F|nr:hypothetical protein [Chryseobacterium sp. Leaf405]KQT22567.1 hypothetical protein ASG22_15025 [Chryseobacterium sp. Leaf405]